MRRTLSAGLFAMFGLLGGSTGAQEVTLETAAPVVVKTVPEAGANGVDPATAEVRVTFSKPMRDGSWSWAILTRESFPEMADKPRFTDDRRICVLPVKLQPGKTYALWINSDRQRNFKDAQDRPAVPYLLVFRTKG